MTPEELAVQVWESEGGSVLPDEEDDADVERDRPPEPLEIHA